MIKISQAMVNRYEKRVNAGVKWLDENQPDWLTSILIYRLNLESQRVCILGQVFGDFWARVAPGSNKPQHNLSLDDAVAFGFAEDNRVGTKSTANYDLLTFVWQQKIKQLKAKV